MPNKATYFITFLLVTGISVGSHLFVYRQLKKLLKKDFPTAARKAIPWIRVVFIYMDLPFLYLFLWRHLDQSMMTVTRVLLYPFTIWQFLMLIWTIILVPMAIWKALRRGTKPSTAHQSIPEQSYSFREA